MRWKFAIRAGLVCVAVGVSLWAWPEDSLQGEATIILALGYFGFLLLRNISLVAVPPRLSMTSVGIEFARPWGVVAWSWSDITLTELATMRWSSTVRVYRRGDGKVLNLSGLEIAPSELIVMLDKARARWGAPSEDAA
jgi:hypothetical protein